MIRYQLSPRAYLTLKKACKSECLKKVIHDIVLDDDTFCVKTDKIDELMDALDTEMWIKGTNEAYETIPYGHEVAVLYDELLYA